MFELRQSKKRIHPEEGTKSRVKSVKEGEKKTELHLAQEKNEDFCKLALRDVI